MRLLRKSWIDTPRFCPRSLIMASILLEKEGNDPNILCIYEEITVSVNVHYIQIINIVFI